MKYFFVSYQFNGPNHTRGFGNCVHETNQELFPFNTVRKNINEKDFATNTVILNWKEISKEQYEEILLVDDKEEDSD